MQTPWINNDGRRKSSPHVATSALIGFRVVRVDTSASSLGDADDDGDIDSDDYLVLESCLTGPLPGVLGAGCDAFDFDADANIDLVDLAQFAVAFNGS